MKRHSMQFNLDTHTDFMYAQWQCVSILEDYKLELIASHWLVLRCWLWILVGMKGVHH